MKVSSTSKAVLNYSFVNCSYFNCFIERANSLKRLSKACLILGETVKSADLAFRALKGFKDSYGNTIEHREVTNHKTVRPDIVKRSEGQANCVVSWF